jgi:ketosteroid isomerase-like protein
VTRLVVLICAGLLAAPNLRAQGTSREALLSADRQLSEALFAHGPNAPLPAALGEDGVLLWPSAGVVRGAPAATKFFAGQPLFEDAHVSWQPLHVEVSADSTLAILYGVTTLDRSAAPPFPAIHRIGRYVAAWKRVQGTWRLAAIALVSLLANGETLWGDALGPREYPPILPTGPAAAFIAADSAFAADAERTGAAQAFAKWAAPDATTFALSGELNVGPARIGAVFAGSTARWAWTPVAAGASADGALGWTVGQATITPATGARPTKTKYLTLWRRMPDGTIRFIADGGNARP